MTRAERIANLIAVILPFAAFVAAVALFWNHGISTVDLSVMGGMYLLTALGITIGYHRLLTHKAFDTFRPLRYAWAIFGSLAVQGPVIDWVADHRKHHAHPDAEGDPHSPHVGHGSGLRGLWHAHTGWLFDTQGQARSSRYARDLLEDPGMRRINRAFPWLVLVSLGLPFAIGYAATATLAGGLETLLWGGLVRIFFVHHVTWSVNSVCHYFGSRRFATEDRSTNVFWLALPSLGEAWHHNHHAFPRSARHGLRWWEVDLSGLVILAMERIGLARNVISIAPERQHAKAAAATSATPTQRAA